MKRHTLPTQKSKEKKPSTVKAMRQNKMDRCEDLHDVLCILLGLSNTTDLQTMRSAAEDLRKTWTKNKEENHDGNDKSDAASSSH